MPPEPLPNAASLSITVNIIQKNSRVWACFLPLYHRGYEIYTVMFPAPSIAEPYGELMICIEKIPRKFQFGKKSAKVYHSLYSSTEQLQMAL
jgi:hypothetical protein